MNDPTSQRTTPPTSRHTTQPTTELATRPTNRRTMQLASRLTIQEASETTGWSPRMLRYVESLGLVQPDRSPAGYRLYGTIQLGRLRTLRELVEQYGIELGDAGFALRLSQDAGLRNAVDAWLAGAGAHAPRLVVVPEPDWLSFEQDKQLRLLAVAGSVAGSSGGDNISRRTATDPRFPTPHTTTGPIPGRKEIA